MGTRPREIGCVNHRETSHQDQQAPCSAHYIWYTPVNQMHLIAVAMIVGIGLHFGCGLLHDYSFNPYRDS